MKCPKCQSENTTKSKFCSECGEPLQPTEPMGTPDYPPDEVAASKTKTFKTSMKDLTIGSTFAGRYQVIEELGKGGMGKVYKVLDKKVEDKVALKLLNLDVTADEETLKRFQNELKLARKISHRNVCRMYDLSEAEDVPFITMEYVSGENLKSLIRRIGQLTIGKAVFITRQVCEGLAEAHGLGIVHRDLKPQNIMIDREGNAQIMDFGIARSLKTKGITDTGVIMGTPEYMSPEQVDGKEVDQLTDIYALGAILYEMVTGRVPFEGDTPLSVAVKQKTMIPADPKKYNAQISEDLNHIIFKCLEKDKKKRYQNTERLLSDLRNIEEGIPTTEKVLPKRKAITSREITVKFNLKKLLKPGIAVVALAIVAIVIWKAIPRKMTPLLGQGKPSLAVMYFENNTGDEGLNHWRKALSDLLISDLSQSKYIAALSGERLFNVLEQMDLLEARSYSSEDLKEVAERGRVESVLVGKLTKAGETFRINTTLQKASTGELIGSETVEGEGEGSIFSMVDELTKKIKENFKLSSTEIASDIDAEVGKITTSSPEAYKYYREGIKFLEKGDYPKSINMMETAVGIDSNFAMAYRALALAYRNLGYSAEAKERLQKAFELSGRISERERYYIRGQFHTQAEESFGKAFEAYDELLNLYPQDEIGNKNLGSLYNSLEEWDKAIERFEVNRKNRDEAIQPYLDLAVAYRAKGLNDKAIEVLEDYLNNISDNASLRGRLARIHLSQGKLDLAQLEAEKAFSLDPTHSRNFSIKGDLFLYEGNLTDAEKEYQKMLETEEPITHNDGLKGLSNLYLLQGGFEESKSQAKQGIELAEMMGEARWKSWHHSFLAYLNLKSGKADEALDECNLALSIALEAGGLREHLKALHLRGLIELEVNLSAKAEETANELKDLVDKGMNKKGIRLFYHLMGRIELARNDFSKAIKYFKSAISLEPGRDYSGNRSAFFVDSMALAYYQDGDLEKAQKEYERIVTMTTGRLYYGDIFAKSFYMLGKIYQQRGDKEKAVENYGKFLDLWKHADPGIPELEDAKKQLEDLKSQ